MRRSKPPTWVPAPAPAPGPTPAPIFPSYSNELPQSQPSNSAIDFSPPLIAMVVIAAAAFLLVTYSRLISRHLFPPLRRIKRSYRRWRCRRRFRPHFPSSDTDSFPPQYESSDGFYVYSPFGLDDSVIKNIPLTIYKPPRPSKSAKLADFHDCAVCLLEFEDGDYLRTLPRCCHSFHADCIDMWLRAHATCPLCRAGAGSMTPLMAARIRPSLDEGVLFESIFLEPLPEQVSGEIQPDRNEDPFSPQRRTIQSEDHRCNNLLLKRSHSFSFERSFASERVALGAATTPHRHQQRRRSFWMKGASSTPFRSIAKSRVFSFRSRVTKSPAFSRHRDMFPMSESSASLRYGGWSRRMKSPMMGKAGMFSSSRMRLGDPEALISPERYGRG